MALIEGRAEAPRPEFRGLRLKGDLLAGDLRAKTDTALGPGGNPAPERRLLGPAPNGFIIEILFWFLSQNFRTVLETFNSVRIIFFQ